MNPIFVRRGRDSLRRKLLEEGMPPLAARVLSARDIAGRCDIVPPLSALPPPDFLPDIGKLCEILAAAIRRGEKIRIVGDYDADGMCATALAAECLRRLGAKVSWRIPERARHGYGLHEEIVEESAADNAAVLLTVDNGVSAADAIARAKNLGIKVCITDHHLPPPQLPEADCIVNPRLRGRDSPGANLAGVGVAFYAMAALRTHLGATLKMSPFLDLVAVGCVADCMPMDALNRTLVGGGLAHIRRGQGRPGLAALVAAAQINAAEITCRDIGLAIAPRINAAGRLDKTQTAMECLLAQNKTQAAFAAAALSRLNEKRKKIVEKIMAQAAPPPPNSSAVIIALLSARQKENPPADAQTFVVEENANYLSGVAGIIAGKLSESHHLPTIIFTREKELWRGSGRAPPGRDLHRLLAKVAAVAPIVKFGGHARAAGVSVRELPPFARAFAEYCRGESSSAPQWRVDEMPPPEEITPEAVAFLEKMVWGESFSRPLFAGAFSVSDVHPLGREREHLRMRLRGGGLDIPALAFFRRDIGEKTAAVFSLTRDLYTGAAAAVIEAVIG